MSRLDIERELDAASTVNLELLAHFDPDTATREQIRELTTIAQLMLDLMQQILDRVEEI